MAQRTPRRPARRRGRRIRLRWLVLTGVLLMAFLYYKPVRSYLETRDALDARRAEVARLARQRGPLERRLARSTTPAALLREARRLGFVKPGERLYIVKGIAEWRQARATIARDGG